MNAPICQDFCTKAECDSLQYQIIAVKNLIGSILAEIDILKIKVDSLETKLENHIQTKINHSSSLAHQYEPNFSLGLNIQEQQYHYLLTSSLTLENITKEAKANLPKNDDLFDISAVLVNKELLIKLYQNGLDVGIAAVDLPFTFQSDFDNHVQTNINDSSNLSHSYKPNIFVNLMLFEQVNNYQLTTRVQIDLEFAQDTINLPKYDGTINIDGSFINDFLYLTVATATDTDTATIYLPLGDEINKYITNITNTMECDLSPVLIAINNCCQELKTEIDNNQALIDSLTYQVDLRTGEIKLDTELIKNALNPSFTLYDSTIDCEAKKIGNEATSPFSYSNPKIVPNGTQDFNGLSGIYQIIDFLNNKIIGLEHNICKLNFPTFSFLTETTISCNQTEQSIEDFLNSNDNLKWLLPLVQELKNTPGSNIDEDENNLNLNYNFFVYLIYTLQLILEQQKTLLSPICTFASGDVVAITASDTVIENVKGKQLILHFVDLINYPKRSKNSGYRPVQIPLPKAAFDWSSDFENLRWITGNFYAKLFLKDNQDLKWKAPITGYFSSQIEADNYFDEILNLTTLIEDYRTYHPTTKSRNFAIKQTRPYRAFVVSVDSLGNPVCETKYQPIVT
jgi:hypothetical protein